MKRFDTIYLPSWIKNPNLWARSNYRVNTEPRTINLKAPTMGQILGETE